MFTVRGNRLGHPVEVTWAGPTPVAAIVSLLEGDPVVIAEAERLVRRRARLMATTTGPEVVADLTSAGPALVTLLAVLDLEPQPVVDGEVPDLEELTVDPDDGPIPEGATP